jgi:formylmethanofuran dehydrogenase subunit E
MHRLPKPDYQRDPSDPDWLAAAVEFHGHLGPWLAAGLRLGMAGLEAVGAVSHFDAEVRVHGPLARPPQSCLLDGLQVSTGATLGKRTIHWTEAEQLVVRIRNTRTGAEAEIRPAARLIELLDSPPSAPPGKTKERIERLARTIAAAGAEEIVEVTLLPAAE